MKKTGSSNSTLTLSRRSRISWVRSALSSFGMITPNRKAPNSAWMPIRHVRYDESSMPTSTIESTPGVSRPAWWNWSRSRVSRGRTTRNMTDTKTTEKNRIRGRSSKLPASTMATTTASSDQATTSSTAAQASARAPISVRCIPRSVRMRASTGKAVTDIDAPTKSANARKSTVLPSTCL